MERNPSVLCHEDAGSAWITLNRPHRFNALTLPMCQRLLDAIGNAATSPRNTGIVLKGSEGQFCGGFDLAGLRVAKRQSAEQTWAGDMETLLQHAVVALLRSGKPTVALLEGVCSGPGLWLLAACSSAISTPDARLVSGYSEFGLTPSTPLLDGADASERLRLVRRFVLAGGVQPAPEALSGGLIDRIVPKAELADAVARAISQAGSGGTHNAKTE